MSSRRHFLKVSALAGALFGSRHAMPDAQGSPARTASENSARRRAKSVIFMVADGMNAAVLPATRHYQKHILGTESAWLSLYNDRPAVRCAMETCSASSIVTDSSASSSCWGCGHRINNTTVNIAPDDGRPLETLLVKARKAGLATGLVTTATATHATPAGFVANLRNRDDEASIAAQYLERRVDVVLGGGQKFFDQNLRAGFKSAGYTQISTRDELLALDGSFTPTLGLFANSHIPYSIDRDNDPALRAATPTLAEMSALALRRLGAASNGFVLQIEAARVDHAAHANDPASLVRELLAFDEALRVVLDHVDRNPGTLLIVTTDHGTGGFNINGIGADYGGSSRALLALAGFRKSLARLRDEAQRIGSADFSGYFEEASGLRLPATALRNIGETLGIGGKKARGGGQTYGQLLAPFTSIGWTTGNHTGDLVEFAALGPGSERFAPFLRNDAVHWHILDALGLPKA
ncbi:MAG: alkaline phosphatase [Puniceicoccales bacterium]|jgi:alkaline phosphatase|nr:alkaline phosphatase [Puniceicoccales bacterium]